MSSPFYYQTRYILDKPHFIECFEQSVDQTLSLKSFTKSLVFMLLGFLFLSVTSFSAYFSWFVVGLGLVEGFSVYYQKSWWVTRQVLSRAAGSELTLTIDNEGIKNHSFYVNSTLSWHDIIKREETDQGFLLFTAVGKVYLSKRVLSPLAIDYVAQHALTKQPSI